MIVEIDLGKVRDKESFHTAFQEAMGFPSFYGRNRDAWIDCMTNVDAPSVGLSTVHVDQGDFLVLQLKNIKAFRRENPELYDNLVADAAFVNWRRIRAGGSPILALSFYT
jgi:RNAse (barnase) inhibitor barstar